MRTAMIMHESWVMREILKEDLEMCDCHVVCTASSRLEANLAYRLHKPDVVVVHTTSTEGPGHRTIDDLLDIDHEAAIIALVGADGDTSALRALVSGARGLLVIPWSLNVLSHEIRMLLDYQPGPADSSQGPKYDWRQWLRVAGYVLSARAFSQGTRLRELSRRTKQPKCSNGYETGCSNQSGATSRTTY